jgi:hypothetical protein
VLPIKAASSELQRQQQIDLSLKVQNSHKKEKFTELAL